MDVNRPIVRLRHLERPAQQSVAHRLRVLARLHEGVLAPELEGALAVVGRRVLDVETGPVGDDALERHELRVGRGPLELGDEGVLEVVERAGPLTEREDDGLDTSHTVDTGRAVRHERLAGDRRLRIPLVVDEPRHPPRVPQPSVVGDRVRRQGIVTSLRDRLPRRLGAQMLRQTPAHGQRERRRLGEERQVLGRPFLRETGGDQAHAHHGHPVLESERVPLDELVVAPRVAVGVDDQGVGEVDHDRSRILPGPRTLEAEPLLRCHAGEDRVALSSAASGRFGVAALPGDASPRRRRATRNA